MSDKQREALKVWLGTYPQLDRSRAANWIAAMSDAYSDPNLADKLDIQGVRINGTNIREGS